MSSNVRSSPPTMVNLDLWRHRTVFFADENIRSVPSPKCCRVDERFAPVGSTMKVALSVV